MLEAGIGFAIKTGLVGKLSGLPKGIDLAETSYVWQSTYSNHQRICDYDDQPDEVKAKFYDDLGSVISAIPKLQAHHFR